MDKARQYKIDRYLNRVYSNLDPVSIQAGIIDACFNTCPMCDHPARAKNIVSGERWGKFLRSHPKLESVCYSGGDMMGHPDLNDIMKTHISTEISFGFITAGYVPPTVDLGLLKCARWVRVSLDTIHSGVYETVRGGMPLETVIKSLERLRKAKVNVEMTLTIGKDNVGTLDHTLAWIRLNGYDADMHPQYGLTYADLGIAENLSYWKEIAQDQGLTFAPFDNITPEPLKCAAVYYQSFIDSKGDIYPCCLTAGDTADKPVMEPLGNIDDWRSYLNNRVAFSELQAHSRPDVCNSCIERFVFINRRVAEIEKRPIQFNSFF